MDSDEIELAILGVVAEQAIERIPDAIDFASKAYQKVTGFIGSVKKSFEDAKKQRTLLATRTKKNLLLTQIRSANNPNYIIQDKTALNTTVDSTRPLDIMLEEHNLNGVICLIKNGATIDYFTFNSVSFLSNIVLEKKHDILRAVLALGIKFNLEIKDNNVTARTPLENSIIINDPTALELLINSCADIAHTINAKGQTPISYSIENKTNAVFDILLGHTTNLNSRTPGEKITPLSQAIISKNHYAANKLLDYGANPNHCVRSNQAPLYLATLSNDIESVTMLLDKNASISSKFEGKCLVSVATVNSNIEILSTLISRHPKYIAIDSDGSTPLMHAINIRDVGKIKVLISHGYPTNMKNSDGRTPYNLAKKQGKEIHTLLKKFGARPKWMFWKYR